jgi:hypothetical protein
VIERPGDRGCPHIEAVLRLVEMSSVYMRIVRANGVPGANPAATPLVPQAEASIMLSCEQCAKLITVQSIA